MKKENGQAILETALVLPIMLIIFSGIVDFGRILYASNHLNMITQEAVRLAAFGKSDYEIRQFVDSKVDLKDKNTITVTLNPTDYTRKSGDYVTLKITYDVNYITPIIGKFIPSPYKVSTQSTMRVE